MNEQDLNIDQNETVNIKINGFPLLDDSLIAMLSALNDIAFILDSESKIILECNNKTLKSLGYQKHEILGKHISILHFTDNYFEELLSSLTDTNISEVKEAYIQKISGDFLPVEHYLSVINLDKKLILYVLKDISKKKIVEKALIESEKRYKKISELSVDSAISSIIAPDGTYKREWAIDNFIKKLGYTIDEISSFEDWGKIIHPEDKEVFRKGLQDISHGKYVSDEFRVVASNGDIFWVENSIFAQYDPDDRRIHVISTYKDISLRKQSEQLINDTKNRLLTVLDGLDAGINVVNIATKEILYANEIVKFEYGDNIIGKKCFEVFKHCQASPCDLCNHKKAKGFDAVEGDYYSWEFYNPEDRTWVNLVDRAIKWINGDIVRLQTAFDITNIKNYENILSSRNNVLSSISASAEKLLMSDSVMEVIEETFEMIGKPLNACSISYYEIQKHIFDYLFVPVKIWQSKRCKKEIKSIAINPDECFNSKDGFILLDCFKEVIELNGSANPIILPIVFSNRVDAVIVIESFKESAELAELEMDSLKIFANLISTSMKRNQTINDLKQSRNELTLANEQKTKFMSIIAHDLKSPFSSFVAMLEELNKNFDDIRIYELKEIASDIHSYSDNLYKMLVNLLDWASSQTGRIRFEPCEFELRKNAVHEIVVLETSAAAKGISIKNELPDNLIVFADLPMIMTVFRNLINNAIKFSNPETDIIIKTMEDFQLMKLIADSSKLVLTDDFKSKYVVVAIQDSGIGISEENLSKLFRIDESHSTLGTNQEKGTGLGLILCKEFIEKNGGNIYVESEIGKGTTFYFSIPRIS